MERLNRFLLEDKIMECWHVTSDLDAIAEFVGESEMNPKTQDELLNMLIGIKHLYDVKFNKMFNVFTSLISKGDVK